jgi:hypothetical protein
MNARPILFSAPMVRALLNGSKSQTRRIVVPQPIATVSHAGNLIRSANHPTKPHHQYQWMSGNPKDIDEAEFVGDFFNCPYGEPGDLIWVREAWRVSRRWDETPPRDLSPRTMTVMFAAGGSVANDSSSRYVLDETYPPTLPDWAGRDRRAFHMMRWMSRLTLRITDIRIERLQEISEADAIVEGIENAYVPGHGRIGGTWKVYTKPKLSTFSPIASYRSLWELINGADSWDANPFVWAISFEVIKCNVDDVLKAAA